MMSLNDEVEAARRAASAKQQMASAWKDVGGQPLDFIVAPPMSHWAGLVKEIAESVPWDRAGKLNGRPVGQVNLGVRRQYAAPDGTTRVTLSHVSSSGWSRARWRRPGLVAVLEVRGYVGVDRGSETKFLMTEEGLIVRPPKLEPDAVRNRVVQFLAQIK